MLYRKKLKTYGIFYLKKADGNFDRKHTTITFSPFVSYDHIGRAKIFKDGSEFFPMFKKIQTEFDIIAILLTTNLGMSIYCITCKSLEF